MPGYYYTYDGTEYRPHRYRKFPHKQKNFKAAYQIGPVNLAGIPYFPNFDNSENWYSGIRKRVLYQPPDPDRQLLAEFYEYVDKFIETTFTEIEHDIFEYESFTDESRYDIGAEKLESFKHPYSDGYIVFKHFEEWVKNTNYSINRRATLRKNFTKRRLRNIYVYSKDYVCKSFIKRESYPEYKCPRVINSRTDTFKCIVGPSVKVMEQVVYDKLGNHFTKHTDRQDIIRRMQEIQGKYNYVFETDYSSFEGSFTRELMQQVELKLFKKLLGNNHRIYKIIERSYDSTIMKSKFGIVRATGSRMSGEMWTSLGNGFTNLMLMKFQAWKHGQPCEGIVEGDDGFFGMNVKYLTSEDMEKLGFKLKCNYVKHINECSFCGINVMPSGKLCPTIPRLLNNFGWTTKPFISMVKTRELLLAKCICRAVESPGVPLLNAMSFALIDKLKTSGVTTNNGYLTWWESQMLGFDVDTDIEEYRVEPTMDDRIWFSRTFRISVEEQLEFETRVKREPFSDFEYDFGWTHWCYEDSYGTVTSAR